MQNIFPRGPLRYQTFARKAAERFVNIEADNL